MSSLLAERMSKYGYQVVRPDGRGLIDVRQHPREPQLFDPGMPGAWPIVVDIQTVASYSALQEMEARRKSGGADYNLHAELREGGVTMVPPYPLLFLEYDSTAIGNDRVPRSMRIGVILQTFRMSDLDMRESVNQAIAAQAVTDGAGNAEWFVETRIVLAGEGDPVVMLPTGSTVYLDETGAFLTGGTDVLVEAPQTEVESWRYNTERATFMAMQACKFWHVRKAKMQIVEDAETRRREKKARKRNRPLIRHHKLVIEPLERFMRHVRESDGKGPKKAMHTVCGTWVTYTAEKPLFGHYVGSVWRPPHMRGSKKLGLVTKDYETGRIEDDEDDSDTIAS